MSEVIIDNVFSGEVSVTWGGKTVSIPRGKAYYTLVCCKCGNHDGFINHSGLNQYQISGLAGLMGWGWSFVPEGCFDLYCPNCNPKRRGMKKIKPTFQNRKKIGLPWFVDVDFAENEIVRMNLINSKTGEIRQRDISWDVIAMRCFGEKSLEDIPIVDVWGN